MLHYHKFRQELFAPQPAQDVYIRRPAGKGWPEQCPPLRAANAFGFDLLANFDITFLKTRDGWKVQKDIVIESDFEYSADDDAPGTPLSQQYAWFWEKGQKLPHVISDHVYPHLRNQVKISSFLFFQTDPNELLLMTEVPNYPRPFRAMSALLETDWYLASYPWHMVIELDPSQKKITIKKGDPICRLLPVRRDTYFAQSMSPTRFDEFFDRGQQWLATHGRVEHEGGPGNLDITQTYVRQQIRPRFVVSE